MKTLKIADVKQDKGPFDATHYISTEWIGNSNDSYFEWTVGEFDDVQDAYDQEVIAAAKQIDPWLISLGANTDEEVLVKHWW